MAENTKKEKNNLQPLFEEVGRIPPQAIDFEEVVLGAMMLESNACALVVGKLQSEMFYKEAHAYIFEAIRDLFGRNEPTDMLAVRQELRRKKRLEKIGGQASLAILTRKTISSANIEYYAQQIIDKYIQRALIVTASGIINDAYDGGKDAQTMLDDAESALFQIAENGMSNATPELKNVLELYKNNMQKALETKSEVRGLATGFTDLDKATGGWQPGNFIIIAARPGMGKTAFVLSLARNIAVEKKTPIALFSLEMTATELVQRMLSSESHIDQHKLKTANINDNEWSRLVNVIDKLKDAPMIIDDTPGLTLFDLRAKCRRMKQKDDIQCVVIDYLQLMTTGSKEFRGNREQEIATISRSLKELGKELGVPIIALSQLNRSVETRSTTTKRPQLSDLRESGSIEQDADMVLFIYRPEVYHIDFEDGTPSSGLAELIIAKNRHGSLSDIRMRFIKEQTRFADLDLSSNAYTSTLSEVDELPQSFMTYPSRINEEYSVPF